MKKKICIYPLIIIGVLLMLSSSCKKDDTTPTYPSIRLKSGSGLNSGAHIFYMALSKDIDYSTYTLTQLQAYRKTDAVWYIDGDAIPFTTDYKEFKLTTGSYHVLISADGLYSMSSKTILTGKQTFTITGSSTGSISIDITQP